MRRSARRDANEPRIIEAVEALRDGRGRALVSKVWPISAEGRPDLMLAVCGSGWLMMEVKTPGGVLTPEQVEWWQATPHCGPGVVVDSPEAACAAVRAFAAGKSLDAGAGATLRSVNFIVSSTGRLVLEKAFDRRTGKKRIGARSELVRLARVIAANAARVLPSLKGAKTRTVVG